MPSSSVDPSAVLFDLMRDGKQRCGAKTRAGHPCKRQVVPGRSRCLNHGGMSTGPKTKRGRNAIAVANRKRWELWRQQKR